MAETKDNGLPKPPRVEASAAWLAEQRAKQRAYQAERAKWAAGLTPVTHREPPEAVVCRCKKCRKSAADQIRLPL
jgi:hypothetical protein